MFQNLTFINYIFISQCNLKLEFCLNDYFTYINNNEIILIDESDVYHS